MEGNKENRKITMAIIKSFTDLSQSKTLSKILPSESADMWFGEPIKGIVKPFIGNYMLEMQCREDKDYFKLSAKMVSPAWSLAALLSILPDSIYDNTDEYSQLEFSKKSVAYHDMNDGIKVGAIKENLVDACYEMILKLKELKLI